VAPEEAIRGSPAGYSAGRLRYCACLTLHRTRHLPIRQQTSVINASRAHLAEFGIVAPIGRNGVEQLLGVVADANDKRLPEVARACVAALGVQLRMLKAQILAYAEQQADGRDRTGFGRSPAGQPNVMTASAGGFLWANALVRMFLRAIRWRFVVG
jgi:hypothetical protein